MHWLILLLTLALSVGGALARTPYPSYDIGAYEMTVGYGGGLGATLGLTGGNHQPMRRR